MNKKLQTLTIALLGILFVVLKLTGHIGWSWWWVTAPFWGSYLLLIVAFFIILMMHVYTNR